MTSFVSRNFFVLFSHAQGLTESRILILPLSTERVDCEQYAPYTQGQWVKFCNTSSSVGHRRKRDIQSNHRSVILEHAMHQDQIFFYLKNTRNIEGLDWSIRVTFKILKNAQIVVLIDVRDLIL